MDKAMCWQYRGYYSNKCLKYIAEELPRIRKEKEDLGIKCKCDDPNCSKCILVNCKEDNCITHAKNKKEEFRLRNKNRK